jgi:GTP-binding protein
LELKLIADVGLVGFPNAGKSSLLAAMSRATPHIAPYPFTTLNPLVGYIEYTDGNRVCVADVPGLIQGASEGKGKGHDFLRHIERTKALLFIVDAAGMDRRCPISDLEILTEELAAYGDGNMLNRRSLVVANKIDLLDNDQQLEITEGLKSVVEEAGIRMEGDIVGISAGVTGEGLPVLSRAIRNIVKLNEADGKRRG